MKYLSRRSHEAPEQVAMTKSKATQGVWQVLGIALVYGAVLAVLFAQPALFDAALGVRLLIVLALTGLVFGALVYVRKRTRAALNQAYDVVAERLEGRTQALHDTQDLPHAVHPGHPQQAHDGNGRPALRDHHAGARCLEPGRRQVRRGPGAGELSRT